MEDLDLVTFFFLSFLFLFSVFRLLSSVFHSLFPRILPSPPLSSPLSLPLRLPLVEKRTILKGSDEDTNYLLAFTDKQPFSFSFLLSLSSLSLCVWKIMLNLFFSTLLFSSVLTLFLVLFLFLFLLTFCFSSFCFVLFLSLPMSQLGTFCTPLSPPRSRETVSVLCVFFFVVLCSLEVQYIVDFFFAFCSCKSRLKG